MSIAVIVPYRSACPHRARAWAWCRKRWEAEYPDWPLVVGEDRHGKWQKGLALRDALERTSATIVIVADADVWGGAVRDAVAAVEDGAPWVQPFDRLVRLNERASERVMAGEDPLVLASDRSSMAERPYVQRTAGGLVVLRRETALEIPVDPRFNGWGGEDSAWAWALETLAGRRVRLPATLVHLWHPPQQRMTRAQGSRENERLKRTYARARGRPEAMRGVLEEAWR